MRSGIIHLSLVKTQFDCPECGKTYQEGDYVDRLQKSKEGLIYKQCTACGIKMGITTNMKGDVVVWDKEVEKDWPK